MTKCLVGWMLILGLPLIGIAAFKTVKESFVAVRVDKNASFNIYKASNYASEIYDSTEAAIEISVEKVNGKNRVQVWDTTLGPCLLKKYPAAGEAISKTITIPAVVDGKEQLEVTYVITYNTQGNLLKIQNGPYALDNHAEMKISL